MLRIYSLHGGHLKLLGIRQWALSLSLSLCLCLSVCLFLSLYVSHSLAFFPCLCLCLFLVSITRIFLGEVTIGVWFLGACLWKWQSHLECPWGAY
jgi:hypothetical protein